MRFDLQRFQTEFVAYITDLGSEQTTELPDSLNHLAPAQNLSLAEALQTYQKDYRARLSDVLSERFSSLHFILGDDEFFALCREFLSRFTSRSYDLGDYGQTFPAFLKVHAYSKTYPYFYELALLELALDSLFHQASESPDDLSLLEQGTDPEQLVFEFIAPLSLQRSAYPLLSLRDWQKRPESEMDFSRGEVFVIFKNAKGVRSKVLTEAQFQILEALKRGEPLGQALEGVEIHDDLGEEITNLFALMKNEGLVKKLS